MHKKSNNLTRKQAEIRSANISNISYIINLDIEKNSSQYIGKTLISFEYRNEKLNELVIDFITKLIKYIKLNGKILNNNNYRKDDFWLYLDTKLLKIGKNFLEISYLNNYDNTGSGFHRFIDPEDGEIYIHTDFEPYDAHRLFPCFDQPDLKATYQLNVCGPPEWEFIHNSESVSQYTKDNKKYISFKKTAIFSTYIFALVVGSHTKWESMYKNIPLRLFCRKSLARYLDTKNLFDITKESFHFLENYFDIPYPYGKYDQIFVPEFNFGAMENVGCVTFTEQYIFRSKKLYIDYLNRSNTIFHEMVHMWFGNLVTMRWWNDLWLNESFADYLSYYAMSHGKLYRDSLEYFFGRKDWAYMQDQLSTTHPIVTSADDTIEAFSNFDGISYAKGASVLKQMMFFIGEDNFKNGIRKYLKNFSEKNTELKDFLISMSDVSGEDINKWSKQWLETTGVNSIKSVIKNNKCTVTQLPSLTNNQLRDHVIKYELYSIVENKIKIVDEGKVSINGKVTKFKLSTGGNFLLLNAKDYDYIKILFSENDINFISDNISRIESRFSRRIIWGNLWQMVRDDKISPIKFLILIEKHLIEEKDITVCQNQMISNAIFVITNFLSDKNTEIWASRLFKVALSNLKNSGTIEKKLTFFDLLLNTAMDRNSLVELKEILDGNIVIKNLKIDQDKRWKIISRLSSYNFSDPTKMIEKEKINDPGDLGNKKSFFAFATIPDKKLKEKNWKIFIENQEKYSTDYIRFGMSGFLQKNQNKILSLYIDQYFKCLIKIYKEKDLHYSSAFGNTLFPKIFEPNFILKKTERFISDNYDLPKLCKKVLIENCDHLKRKIPIIEKQK